MKKKLKSIFIILLSIITLLSISLFTLRSTNQKKYRISTDNGIEFYDFIEINGTQQYVQIRGNDKENPLIIFVHGGPGFPITYLSTYHQQYLEDNFTLVNYDQRGSGRTYYKNLDNDALDDSLSPEILLQDLDEIIDFTCNKLDKDQVIIMGQSWGTVLGMNYINHHPDKVQAYIGVGQVIDFDLGKIYSAKKALLTAKEEDIDTLNTAIKNFENTKSVSDINIENLENLILTSGKYLQSGQELSGLKQMWLGLTSPTMNLDDIKWFLQATSTEKIFELESSLINYMYYDFDINDLNTSYNIPIYFIQGSHDYITPTDMVESYFETLDCEDKDLLIQEDAGHTPFLDNPVIFANFVIELLE